MIRSCKTNKHRARRIGNGVEWCRVCGSYRRWVTATPAECAGLPEALVDRLEGGFGRWSRWVPCGVNRLAPAAIGCDSQQLDLLDRALDDAKAALDRAVIEVATTLADVADTASDATQITAAPSGASKPTLRIVR